MIVGIAAYFPHPRCSSSTNISYPCRITRISLRSLSINELVSKSISLYKTARWRGYIHQRRSNLKSKKKARWLRLHASDLFWWLSSCSAPSQLWLVVCFYFYEYLLQNLKFWYRPSSFWIFVIFASFFFLFVLTARSLRTLSNGIKAEKGYVAFVPKEEGVPDAEDLISVDYTPARKKPPIHNW